MKNTPFTLLFILITAICFSQNKTYLHCGAIFNAQSGKLEKEKTIVISGKEISEVLNGYIVAPSNDINTIDLKTKTVLPGLIDMHVHVEGEFSKTSYSEQFRLNEADLALRSTLFLKRTIDAGFTTVRDLGGTGVNTALARAVEKGTIVGPRIYSAGKAIATTGGHADPTNGWKQDLMGDPGPEQGVVNGPDDCRKAVRQRYKNGAHVIKITATGGVLSEAKNSSNPQFTIEEVKAICETANDYGMIVAAHAHGDEGMQRAILGGVKTIEHGTLMSDKTMDLMKIHDVYLVPTITAGKEVTIKADEPGFYPEIVVPKAKEIGPKIQNTFGRAYAKGVGIAFGTDAGVFKHGNNAMEFVYMVEAGMPPAAAIQSATITNAKLLKNDNIGLIEKGKYADIIAVEGNPLEDIKTLLNVDFVMKEGMVIKQ
ncbi:metal-dependent hydrolase family protein [Luteibaculum oceani]|uniref:Amidohydrolase family protein n=1 Tax=Luteibaculum oceani TaxID=1294296 RepID=A0A5C6UVV7_9FLAO|nr:amidohydrolase family protein [Luteibaculum oceani]TXC76266.1 amidohydrolase family protein [Luteibaculum oceani]